MDKQIKILIVFVIGIVAAASGMVMYYENQSEENNLLPSIQEPSEILNPVAQIANDYSIDSYDKPTLQKMAQVLVEDLIDKYDVSSSKWGQGIGMKDSPLIASDELTYVIDENESRYGLIVDYETQIILAHPNTELIGIKKNPNTIEPFDEMWKNVKKQGFGWANYEHVNPDTQLPQLKMSWFKYHDGLVFISGFYVGDVLIDYSDVIREKITSLENDKSTNFDIHSYPEINDQELEAIKLLSCNQILELDAQGVKYVTDRNTEFAQAKIKSCSRN